MTFTHEQVGPRASHRHGVHFYRSEPELAAVVAGFLATGLARGEAALVVATPAHRSAIVSCLASSDIGVEAAIERGALVLLDGAETLARISGAHGPDPARFAATMEAVLPQTSAVAIFGEMVMLLCQAGLVDQSIGLEQIWCEWLEGSTARLLCAYPSESLDDRTLRRVRELHDRVSGDAATNHPARRRSSVPYAARIFPPDLAAIRQARLFVTQSVGALGAAGTTEEVAWAVGELAANAVLHARTTFLVELATLDDGIEVSVRDLAPALPTMPAESTESGGGRGLRIVAALARRWGVERDRAAKVVWAEFPAARS